MAIRLESEVHRLRQLLDDARVRGVPIGFVATMGFLHEGHRSLIEASRAAGNFTVVSVFVNPTQFGPNEDFDSYPRDSEGDFRLCAAAGADLVWFPAVSDLYSAESQTAVLPGDLAQRLCGLSRPQFFGGICTVVLKLFGLIRPDKAYFGEKDYQQLIIIKRMAADFYLGVDVIGLPTVREPDGLAKSSRNARLGAENRELALALFRAISAARGAFLAGERDAAGLADQLMRQWPSGIELDYLEFREPHLLRPVERLEPDTRLFLGAWLKGVRLIDNAPLG